jgi:hypothetical protein
MAQMRLIRKRVSTVLRSRGSDSRINGNTYDEPLHKHDYGPRRYAGPGPLNEAIPTLPGNYDTYRRMDRSPFLAMAKEFKLGPVRNATGTWKTRDNSVPDAWLKFTQDTIEPLIADLISNLSDALSMGNSPNRLVWDTVFKPTAGLSNVQVVPREIYPLHHDSTGVRIEETNQYRFLGLSTPDGDLSPSECIYWRYDPRPYDGYYWFGRSLHENHRDEFAEYREDRQLMHRLAKKLSGVVAIAKVIKGLARDQRGRPIDRFQAAKQIVNTLAYSMGAAFEVEGIGVDEIKRNPKLADISDIMVEALDLGSSSPAYGLLLQKRQQSQRECVMGYLVPPPSIMDVQTGGKGDTETKTDSGLTQSEVIGLLLHKPINEQLVDPFLVANFGPEAKGAVYRAPTKFTEAQRLASDRIMAAMVNNPIFFQAALEHIDQAQVMRDSNTPLLQNKDSVDITKRVAEIQKEQRPPQQPQTKAIAISGGTRTKQGKNRGTQAK